MSWPAFIARHVIQAISTLLIPRCLGRVQGQPERTSFPPRPSGLGYADLPGQVQRTLCHSRCTTRVAHAQQSVRGDASRIIRVVQHVEEVEVELQIRPLPLLSCFHYFSTGCGLMDQSAELGRRRLSLSWCSGQRRSDIAWSTELENSAEVFATSCERF